MAVTALVALLVGVLAGPADATRGRHAKQIDIWGSSRNVPIGGSWLDHAETDICGGAKYIVTTKAYFSKITSSRVYLTKVRTTYQNLSPKKGPAIWGGNLDVYSTKNFFHRTDYDRGPIRPGVKVTFEHVANRWVGYTNHRFVVAQQVIPTRTYDSRIEWYCAATYAAQLIYKGA